MQTVFSSSSLIKLSTHFIGNTYSEEDSFYSNESVDISNEDLKRLLLNYFTSPFKNKEEDFSFFHESEIGLNTVKHYIDKAFKEVKNFHNYTVNIAKHLFSVTNNPNIKSGELHFAYLKNVILDEKVFDAISIVKTEGKQNFFKVDRRNGNFDFKIEKGISEEKVDKACLILNLHAETGYKIFIIDETNKGEEAIFWKDKFLKIKPANDDYHFTKNYLTITKEFITKKLDTEYEISNKEKISYLNNSIQFFKENEKFKEKDFTDIVFQDEDVIKSFKKFKSEYSKDLDLKLESSFTISNSALKKQSRVFKSVLKLDKNFHIYIHGNTELIEKGFDSKRGKNYYKIYFDDEL